MKFQLASQGGCCSDLAAFKAVAIAETREEDDDECDYKENNAQNYTGPMPSSALDVPGLPPLPRAPSDHDEVAASSIMIKKTTVKQLPCKGVCIGNLSHLSADAFGINPVCKKDIDRCLQFV